MPCRTRLIAATPRLAILIDASDSDASEANLDPIDKELLKGSMTTVILTVLSRKEMYGYQIIKSVEQESKGALLPKEGTVYPVLHQLEQDGAIASRWEETTTPGGRARKYYRITSAGRKLLAKKTQEWRSFRSAMEQLLGAKQGREALV